MFNLSNVISFFEENINDTKYQFKSLNTIQQQTNSDFIKDSVIQTLYSYISEYKIPFNTFMSNPDVTAFLNYYNASLERYKSHESEIQKLNDILLVNDTNISNKNDLISYVIIESLIDFYDSKKYVIHKNNNKTGFYNKYFNEIIELENSHDFISSFQSKPYGFYVCKLPFQQYSTFFYGYKYAIISNQPNALYCYELNNSVNVSHGFNIYNLEIKNDIFRKSHNFKIEMNENSKSALSTYSNDSIFKDTITKLVFKCFLYWAESMKEETFEKGGNGFDEGVYVASNDGACNIWNEFIEERDEFGACSPTTDAQRMQANTLYWMTDRTPHESLVSKKGFKRQFFRVVADNVSVWYSQHNTPNPFGIKPNCEIVHHNKFH